MARARVKQLFSPKHYNLELTEGEVDFLLGFMVNCGGGSNSPHKYARRITAALSKVTGYTPEQTDAFLLSYGYVDFADYGSRPVPLTFAERLHGFMEVMNSLPDDELAKLIQGKLDTWEKDNAHEKAADEKFFEELGEAGLIKRTTTDTAAEKPHAGPRRKRARASRS